MRPQRRRRAGQRPRRMRVCQVARRRAAGRALRIGRTRADRDPVQVVRRGDSLAVNVRVAIAQMPVGIRRRAHDGPVAVSAAKAVYLPYLDDRARYRRCRDVRVQVRRIIPQVHAQDGCCLHLARDPSTN